MQPADILARKSCSGAAKALAEYLRIKHNANNVYVWSPEETKSRGWGSGWAVCWEEGPYEWAVNLSMGQSPYASELRTGVIGAPFPQGLHSRDWFAEPYNGFILNFYPG